MIRGRSHPKVVLSRFLGNRTTTNAPPCNKIWNIATESKNQSHFVPSCYHRSFSSNADTLKLVSTTKQAINLRSNSDQQNNKRNAKQVHELRQQQLQKTKEIKFQARHHDHSKRTLLQNIQSRINSQKRLQSEAAKAIGPLLKLTPKCYQNTLAELDLNTYHLIPSNIHDFKDGQKRSRKARKRHVRQKHVKESQQNVLETLNHNIIKQNNGLNSQYRRLYFSSINSFVQCLQTDHTNLFPSLNQKDTNEMDHYLLQAYQKVHSENISHEDFSLEELQSLENLLTSRSSPILSRFQSKGEYLLNQLVDAGFANGKFAKQYRSTKVKSMEIAQAKQKLLEKKEILKRRTSELEYYEQQLSETVKEFEVRKKIRHQERMQEKEDKKKLWNVITKSVSDLVSSSNDEKSEQQKMNDKRESEHKADVLNIKSLNHKISECKRLLEGAKLAVIQLDAEIIEPSIKDMASSFSSLNYLSSDEYKNADDSMNRVLNELCPAFAAHIHQRHTKLIEQCQLLDSMTDLTKPHDWYKRARKMKRKIIFHGGPTNSGKTHTALERLKQCRTGLYLGPLRLLAAEIYERLMADGIDTNLYTGQEFIENPGATHLSATTEIAPSNIKYDVAVIDEIQMIGDPSRGHAWTRALQGLLCKEIHVCGGMEALDIVKKIAKNCGDELVIKDEYKRFSNLHISDISMKEEHGLDAYTKVEPGDCVVAFSRNDIFAIKREIESNTNHKCSVIYGSLPPQIRVQQAQQFNDPNSKHDILIASDAIGMGLNLHIKRIIFNSMLKSNGEEIILVPHTSVKQISGRAGRRGSPYPDGIVTCLNPDDMEYLQTCMYTDIPPVEGAGLLPTSENIEDFSHAMATLMGEGESDELHVILQKFDEMATLQGDYFLCRQTQILRIAKFLADVPLSIEDKYTFCMSPVQKDDPRQLNQLKDYAWALSRGESRGMNSSTYTNAPKSFEDISRLCKIHNELDLFIWACSRFPDNFVFDQSSLAIQEQIIRHINDGLVNSDNLHLNHCYKARDIRLRKNLANRNEREALEENNIGLRNKFMS